MVEKVARAISRENGDDFDAIPKSKQEWINARGQFGNRFRDINEPKQADYLDMARAAIAAMSEPTREMLDAANDAFPDAPYQMTCSELGAKLYRAMIAAAAEDAT